MQRSWQEALSLYGALTVGLCALLLGPTWFAAHYVPGIARDAGVWSTGQLASNAKVGGACRTKISLLPFTTCRFDVAFDAQDGARMHTESEALLFGGLNFDTQAIVKFDAQEPQRVAVSWTAELISVRWLTLAGLCALFVLLGASIVWAGLRSVGEYRMYRRLAGKPQPIRVRITERHFRSGANYSMQYVFEGDVIGGDGLVRRVTGRQHMKVLSGKRGVPPQKWTYEEPLFTQADRSEALALTDAQGRVLLVKQSLKPFCLSDAEKMALQTAGASANQ